MLSSRMNVAMLLWNAALIEAHHSALPLSEETSARQAASSEPGVGGCSGAGEVSHLGRRRHERTGVRLRHRELL